MKLLTRCQLVRYVCNRVPRASNPNDLEAPGIYDKIDDLWTAASARKWATALACRRLSLSPWILQRPKHLIDTPFNQQMSLRCALIEVSAVTNYVYVFL